MTKITRDHLTDDSKVLHDAGRIAIHDDCIMRKLNDDRWVRDEFADHVSSGKSAKEDRAAKSSDTPKGTDNADDQE